MGNTYKAIASTRENKDGKSMFTIEVRLEGIRTHKAIPENLAIEARKHNWRWAASVNGETGFYVRSFSDKEKRDSVLAYLNGKPATKSAPKAEPKSAPKADRLPDFSHMTKAEIIAWAMTYTK